MSLPARISFAQVCIFLSIIFYIAARGFFVMLNVGLLWIQPGGFLLIILPLPAVVVFGFAACVISYSFSYLGLYLMDSGYHMFGIVAIFLSVIAIPIGFATYSWFAFTVF
jgi:hypothetical protein